MGGSWGTPQVSPSLWLVPRLHPRWVGNGSSPEDEQHKGEWRYCGREDGTWRWRRWAGGHGQRRLLGWGGVTLCDLLDPSGDLQQCVQGAGKEGLS